VNGRRLDQGPEQCLLLRVVRGGELRMPLHSEQPWMAVHLERLDDSVRGAGDDGEPRRHHVDDRLAGQLALQIELPIGAELDDDVFARAKEVLEAHPGTAPVELRLGSDNGITVPVFRSRTLKADPSRDTIEALQKMFGKARVRLVRVGQTLGEAGPGTR